MDDAWEFDHYIDLENVPEGALDAADRYEFIAALYAAGISIIGKIALTVLLLRAGKRLDSSMLRANGKNMQNDILISAGVSNEGPLNAA